MDCTENDASSNTSIVIYVFVAAVMCLPSPGRFTPGERAPGTHWIGGWVDLRAGLDDLEKRKFLTLPGLELQPLDRPARS
jgi:hypothetical protein